ncbi:MAG: Hsp20 family protein [Hyphomicrobiales bacterium]|nr:Hsp20 family protein [Hyphomicrobiales bacterium]MDE2115497.1 Hsp20 family protein [Hyphomicrobiales bacterium]
MRHYDLSPLYRSTIGFDRLFSLLDQASGLEPAAQTYPPYNIERTGENAYRISIAVAGFAESELVIETKENTLTVQGSKVAPAETDAATKVQVLHQGIAARAFERRFQLADHVKVVGAGLENGLLNIELTHEVPEAAQPRRIPIGKSLNIEASPAKKAA